MMEGQLARRTQSVNVGRLRRRPLLGVMGVLQGGASACILRLDWVLVRGFNCLRARTMTTPACYSYALLVLSVVLEPLIDCLAHRSCELTGAPLGEVGFLLTATPKWCHRLRNLAWARGAITACDWVVNWCLRDVRALGLSVCVCVDAFEPVTSAL